MTVAVRVQGLVKTFGKFRALDGLDLDVEVGEVHGFLGPNGSGKSTTIRVLLGLLRADAGEVVLLGGDPWRDAVVLHRRLAYVPGDVSLWPKLWPERKNEPHFEGRYTTGHLRTSGRATPGAPAAVRPGRRRRPPTSRCRAG